MRKSILVRYFNLHINPIHVCNLGLNQNFLTRLNDEGDIIKEGR